MDTGSMDPVSEERLTRAIGRQAMLAVEKPTVNSCDGRCRGGDNGRRRGRSPRRCGAAASRPYW